MEWTRAPWGQDGGMPGDRGSFVKIHPDSQALLSSIGLWPLDSGDSGRKGGTPRQSGWPNEQDDDTPQLTEDDEKRYWDESKAQAHHSTHHTLLAAHAASIGRGEFEYEGVSRLPPTLHEWQENDSLRGRLLQALDDLASSDRREKELVDHVTSMQGSESNELRILRRKVADLDEDARQHQSEVDVLKQEVARRDADVARLVAEVQGKNDEIESSREEIFRVEKERDGVTKAKVAAEHEVATLNQLIDGMRRNSGENSGRGGGGSTVALMSENEAGCSREVSKELAASALLLQQQTGEIVTLSDTIKELRKEVFELRSAERVRVGQTFADGQNITLKAEIRHKDEHISRLRDQVVEAQTALAMMRVSGSLPPPDAEREAEVLSLRRRVIELEAEVLFLSAMSSGSKRL